VTVRGNSLSYCGNNSIKGGLNEGRGITIEAGANNGLLENNVFLWCGDGTGTEGSAIEGYASTGWIVRGNYVQDGSTALEIKNAANNWEVYGNILVGRSAAVAQYGFFSGGSDSTGSEFYNNTIVSLNTGGVGIAFSSGSQTRFANNLISAYVCFSLGASDGVLDDTEIASFDSITDHNLLWGTYPIRTVKAGPTYTAYASIAAWQAVRADQFTDSLDTDPRLNADYSLAAGSPARGAGTWIAGVRAYDDLPLDASPDIGAVQDRTAAGRRGGVGGSDL
jgi:hypothetical protein